LDVIDHGGRSQLDSEEGEGGGQVLPLHLKVSPCSRAEMAVAAGLRTPALLDH